MYNLPDYCILKEIEAEHTYLRTQGLLQSLEVELQLELVLPEALARGIITQVAHFCAQQLEAPCLFNDIYLPDAFEPHEQICLMPFVLLENEGICHIILPDLKGYYPWQQGCDTFFKTQVDEHLLLCNFLGKIKYFFLNQLLLEVAEAVFLAIHTPIHLSQIPICERADYLAEQNIDLFIALTVCFNKTMSTLNDWLIKTCEPLPLDLYDLQDPCMTARALATMIYDETFTTNYTEFVLDVFEKLTKN